MTRPSTSERIGMGTWIKETSKAIYLMQGGYWISRITKYPSSNNPNEQVVNITGLRSWFTRSDFPRAMTVSPKGPEPPQIPPPPPTPPIPQGATAQINVDGLKIVKDFEGLELTAYQDSVGVWTIGYGHTAAAGPPEVYPGQTITEAEAEEILKRDLRLFEKGVRDLVPVSISSNQFSALVSFSFNVGLGALADSTLLRKLNAGEYQGAASEFPRWVRAGGISLPGLVRRRNAERALFLGQDYTRYL